MAPQFEDAKYYNSIIYIMENNAIFKGPKPSHHRLALRLEEAGCEAPHSQNHATYALKWRVSVGIFQSILASNLGAHALVPRRIASNL